MRILIELPSWLGDAVMATPAIENLVNYYDESEVILIGSFISIEALKNHPRISNTYVIRKKYTSLYKISKKLGKFDIFFSFRGSFRTKFFKLLISSKKKFQFDGNRYQNRHQVEKYNDFINENLNTHFHSERLIIHPSLKQTNKNSKPILGINPGASYGDSKRWYPKEFAKVATELSHKFDILIFGDVDEKNIAISLREFVERIKNHASAGAVKEGAAVWGAGQMVGIGPVVTPRVPPPEVCPEKGHEDLVALILVVVGADEMEPVIHRHVPWIAKAAADDLEVFAHGIATKHATLATPVVRGIMVGLAPNVRLTGK